METTPNENIALSTDLNDPLDEDLSKMDTSYPTAPNGYVGNFVVKSAEVKPNKENTGHNWVIKLASLQELTSNPQNGQTKQIAPGGIIITHYVGLTPMPARPEESKGEYSLTDIAMGVAKIVQWAKLGSCSAKALKANPVEFLTTLSPQLAGKTGAIKLELTKEREDKRTGQTFAPANRVKQFVNQ